jgi:hypothetical protein
MTPEVTFPKGSRVIHEFHSRPDREVFTVAFVRDCPGWYDRFDVVCEDRKGDRRVFHNVFLTRVK